MATFNGFATSNPTVAFGGKSAPPRSGVTLDPGGVTTYFYRASNGSRGSTTDLAAVPAGAVIERTVTT
jgi:hypothetical protein